MSDLRGDDNFVRDFRTRAKSGLGHDGLDMPGKFCSTQRTRRSRESDTVGAVHHLYEPWFVCLPESVSPHRRSRPSQQLDDHDQWQLGRCGKLVAGRATIDVSVSHLRHEWHRRLELLHDALRREANFLARRPQCLFQQMWNLCWWYDHPCAEIHYERPNRPGTSAPSRDALPRLRVGLVSNAHLTRHTSPTRERGTPAPCPNEGP